MSRLKAIKTHYRGYRFRSRLEARWAVCFDHMGLDWSYEEEGFELPSGRYLPDFVMRNSSGSIRTYVEIKPTKPDHRTKQLCFELAEIIDGKVLLLCGSPGAELDEEIYFTEASFCSMLFSGFQCGMPPLNSQVELGIHLPWHLQKNGFGENLPPSWMLVDSLENQNLYIKTVAELDKEFFRKKYSKEHERWKYGVVDRNWFFNYRSADTYEMIQSIDDIDALNAGRAARFEYGEAG